MEQDTQRIRTFSINLPFPLYEKLLNKAGKGRVSTFIKKLVEKELSDEEEELAQAYRECYSNPRMIEEAKL
jgi:ribosomal protein S20